MFFIVIIIIIVIAAITSVSQDNVKVAKRESIESINEKILKKALIDKNDVVIEYQSKYLESTIRTITPIRLYDAQGNYGYYYKYVEAFCHLRNEKRNFKIARIKKVTIIENEKTN